MVAHTSPSNTGPRPSAAVPVSALWALSAVSLLAAAALRAPRPRHRPLAPAGLHLHAASPRPPATAELVSVLLPLNPGLDTESAVAAVCAALTQRAVADIDVVVLDEGCPQQTREELRRRFGDDPRVRMFGAAPLPLGWSRHAHRAHQLAVAARGKVLLFGDPAAPLGPCAAAAATALLRQEGLDLVILDSGQCVRECGPGGGSVAQTLIGPLLRSLAEHPGRFTMAVDCAVYWRAGGFRADAGNPDPLSLLRIVRRATGRVAVADSRRVIPPVRIGPHGPAAAKVSAARPVPTESAGNAVVDGGTGTVGTAGTGSSPVSGRNTGAGGNSLPGSDAGAADGPVPSTGSAVGGKAAPGRNAAVGEKVTVGGNAAASRNPAIGEKAAAGGKSAAGRRSEVGRNPAVSRKAAPSGKAASDQASGPNTGALSTVSRNMTALWERSLSLARGWPG